MVTVISLVFSCMLRGVHVWSSNEICEVQYIYRTATNQYDPLGNILKQGLTEQGGVLTLRGKMLPARKELKDGIEVSSSFASDPFLRIFIKNAKERMAMERHTEVKLETVVAILDGRKDYKKYYKEEWGDVTYSLSGITVYQIISNTTGFTIRINRSYRYFPYPEGFNGGPRPVGYVAQIGRTTAFKEVSWCPYRPRSSIAPSSILRKGGNTSWNYLQDFPDTEISLTCVGEGAPPLSFVWFYKDHQITPTDKEYSITDGVTVEGTTLTRSILNFTMAITNEGWYSCRAVTSGDLYPGQEYTSYIEVRAIIPLSTEIVDPRYRILIEGQSTIFTCNIEEWRSGAGTAAWQDLAHTPRRSYKTSTQVLSPTKKQALLIFQGAQLEDSGIFQCGREVASLFVWAAISRVDVDFKKVDDIVFITCTTRGNPMPKLHLHVFQDEFHVSDPIIVTLYQSSQGLYNVSQTYMLDTSQTYIRIRFKCTAEQTLPNRTRISVSTQGNHIMPHPQAPSRHPVCRITMATPRGNITWVGGYTPRLSDPASGVKHFECSDSTENYNKPIRRVSLMIPHANLLYGKKLELRCQILIYPGFLFLYLIKDWSRVLRRLEIKSNFVRPYVEVEISRVRDEDDGEYSCLATNREFTADQNVEHIANEDDAWESAQVMVFRKGIISIVSPDFLSNVTTNNASDSSLPHYTVLNGTHVLFKCSISGYPTPHHAVLVVNQSVVAEATKTSASSLEVRVFFPINKTSLVACYASQSRFNTKEALMHQVVVVPVTIPSLPFRVWDTWSCLEVLLVFGGGSFASMALLTSCWLGLAALYRIFTRRKTRRWNITRTGGGHRPTPSPVLKPREQFTKIKDALTQLIEQPFLESYTFIRNSVRTSTVPTSTESSPVEVLDPRSFGDVDEGLEEEEEEGTEYDDVADDFVDTTDDNLDDEGGTVPTNSITVQADTHPNMDMGVYHREKDFSVKDMDVGKRQGVVFYHQKEGQEG